MLLIQVCGWGGCMCVCVIRCLVLFVCMLDAIMLCLFCACLFISVGFVWWYTKSCMHKECLLCTVHGVNLSSHSSAFVCWGVFSCVTVWLYSKLIGGLCASARVHVVAVVRVAEGMDEETEISRARQRWHTWPVKRALHLTAQLLPRLWWVGAGARQQGDA